MSSITDLLKKDNEYFDSQKIPGFVQGVVVENNNADFKGMVKVEFTAWESGKNMCEWVRLVSPYTGKNYGIYCVPEIDEIVLVGFIGGSLKRPFLLGSLYPGGAATVNDNFDKKNINKRLKTKGGMDILINDEDGKQKKERCAGEDGAADQYEIQNRCLIVWLCHDGSSGSQRVIFRFILFQIQRFGFSGDTLAGIISEFDTVAAFGHYAPFAA